jgi:hypothetical protein
MENGWRISEKTELWSTCISWEIKSSSWKPSTRKWVVKGNLKECHRFATWRNRGFEILNRTFRSRVTIVEHRDEWVKDTDYQRDQGNEGWSGCCEIGDGVRGQRQETRDTGAQIWNSWLSISACWY